MGEGIPISFEVYPGNTFEGKTIKDIVAKLREKFSIRRFIFVGDRGLFSKQNLTELRGENKVGEFIVGMKLAVFKKRHDEFYNLSTLHCGIKRQQVIYPLTLCFIAYYCESLMTKALREKKLMLKSSAIDSDIIDPRPLTVVEVMRELQEVRAVPVKVRNTTLWVRTDINGNANSCFRQSVLSHLPKCCVFRKTKM